MFLEPALEFEPTFVEMYRFRVAVLKGICFVVFGEMLTHAYTKRCVSTLGAFGVVGENVEWVDNL